MTHMLTASNTNPPRRSICQDVLTEPDRTGRFFAWPHPTSAAFRACARHLDCRRRDRSRIAEILLRQNLELDAPPPALQAARDFARPDAVCAFTGQQAGLFGGPLYTVYKSLTLLGWAEKLRAILDRPVVPVFWIAADDHDFEEVRWTGFPDLENRVQKLELPGDTIGDRTPISGIVLPPEIEDVRAALRAAQLQTEFSDEVFAALAEDYRPGRSMPEAFGRWMSRLLGPLGLVVFNPADPEAKVLMEPLFARELEQFDETAAALRDINQLLQEAGYDRQVSHPESNTHLFYFHNGRHAVRISEDHMLMTDEERIPHPPTVWRKRLQENPAAFSPGVLFRPVIQSHLFPVVSVVCGPSEIAYWAQARALFDRFDTLMPVVLPRSCATIVEQKTRRAADALGHAVTEFFGDIEQLINRHFERSFPADLEREFEAERREIDARLARLRAIVCDFEPTLDKTFEISAGRIGATWDHLQKKVFQAHKRKGDEIRARFYKLGAHLYPLGQPQERVFGITYYLNKYGFPVISRIREQLRIGTPDHQLIEP